jgi:uncharacterized membrane protein
VADSLHLWLEYLLRFSHLVAGIAWIGSSFYFIWLDSSFEVPPVPRKNVEGELFMVHGGFYYQVEKKKIYPGELPKVLHWFKWEATLTWLTGFLLLIVVYYLKGASLLIDPAVSNLTQASAVGVSLGILVGSWLFYDFIWNEKYLKSKPVSTLLSIFFFLGLIILNHKIFSGRGAFIQTGAILGSMMLLNVWMRILPGQRKMIREAEAGQVPDYSVSLKAKTRSVHNTYFIFPVLFIMLSNHYPEIYNHPQNWLLLIILGVSGAMVRHAMVTKDPKQRWTLIPAAIGLLSLVFMTRAVSVSNAEIPIEPVSFAQVNSIFQARCVTCHSAHPTDDIFKVAPKNLMLESEAQILQAKPLILQQVVIGRTMPLANKTQMTDEERTLIGQWIRQ